MACKRTVQKWHRAIDVLTSSATKFLGMEDEILPILKYSYDSLNGEEVKSCFLYFSLFPEDDFIKKEELIELWIGEGFIDEKKGREWALNQGYEILGTLVRACLLLDGENKTSSYVKMHDVVRQMALWIYSDLGKHKERCVAQASFELYEIPKVKNWKHVSRMLLMDTMIENICESLDCPLLTTFILRRNYKLVTISGEFFKSMSKLLVLDLCYSISFSGLPEQISSLVSLRHLNLSCTKIKRLPVGLQELKMLIHLNLESTGELESIQGVSKLSSLRTLKLWRSNLWLDISLMKELQLLEHLEFVSITIPSSLVRESLYNPTARRCIQQFAILDGSEESVGVLVLPDTDNFCKAAIVDCGTLEIKIEKTRPWDESLSTPCFSNLSYVLIGGCNSLKDLTWLLFAPNLTRLRVYELEQLEEIISKEKGASVLKNEEQICPFQKLESLKLDDLPKLQTIYWNALPFQCLRSLRLHNCPKLRKLPLDSKSELKVEEFVIDYDDAEWIERVEWEDEATRLRFLEHQHW